MFLEALAIGVGAAAIHLWTYARRWEKVHRLLLDGHPAEFLEAIDKELERARDVRLKAVLLLSKTAGLTYLGRFDEAIRLLEDMDVKELQSDDFQAIYYNNLLYNLLMNRQYVRAHQLVARHAGWLTKSYGTSDIDMSLRGTMAVYDYFSGRLERARSELEFLMSSERPTLAKASYLYFLARLDLHEGHVERGLARLKDLADMAPHTFFVKEIAALSSNDERIGAPGDASLDTVQPR